MGVLVLEEVGVLHFRRTTHSCLFILFLTVRLRWMISSSISASLAYQIAAWIQQNPIERLVFRFPDTSDFQVTAVGSSKWPQFAGCAPHPSVEPTVRSQHRQLRARVVGGDAPSSCLHNFRMSLACSPSWLSRSSTFTLLRPSFSCRTCKGRAKSGVR